MLSRILNLGVLLIILSMGLVACEKPMPCPEGQKATAEIGAQKAAPRELTPTECSAISLKERDTALENLAKTNKALNTVSDERDVATKKNDAFTAAAEKANLTVETEPTTGEIAFHPNTIAAAAPAPSSNADKGTVIEAAKPEHAAQPTVTPTKAN